MAALRIVSVATDATSATLKIAAFPGYAYQVQARSDFNHWANFGWTTLGLGSVFEFVDAEKHLHPRRF